MTSQAASRPTAKCLVGAGILTAAIAAMMGYGIRLLAPSGCDASAWLCLLPLLLWIIGPVAGLCLPILVFFKRRRLPSLPDSFLAVTLLTGCAAQLLASAYGLGSASDHVRRIFFFDVLLFPQGFVAGIMVGAVFCVSLASLRKP